MRAGLVMNAATILVPRRLEASWYRASVELVVVVGLLEAELWSLRGWAPPWLNVLVFAGLIATIALSVRRRRTSASGLPEPTAPARAAWIEAALASLVLSVILLVAGFLVGDANETFEFLFLRKPPVKLLIWVLGKFLAAFGQQLALQRFLWPVCQEITRSRSIGAALAATIFGLVHLPSPTLVAITLLAGLIWVGLFQRSGRIAPLVASHMILATLAHGGLPERLTYDMRVGLTALADQPRFIALENPKTRLINRRLKEHRAALLHFASADYYQAQGGTNSAFIRGLFRDILGRTATDADVAFWQNLRLPHLRQQIPSIFLASDEFAAILKVRQAADAPAFGSPQDRRD